MGLGIDEFIGSIEKGGQRPNLFDVNISGGVFSNTDLHFKAKATTLPSEETGVIEVPFMGRTAKIAGDRTYPEWTITCIAEEALPLRKSFEEWMQKINDPENNTTSITKPQDYMSVGTVTLYNKDGSVSAVYEMRGVWVSSIGEISLAWDSNDALAEFDVTLQLQYFLRVQ